MMNGDMPHLKALYDQAVQTAREGRREQAVELFRAYLMMDRNNPLVWAWLADLLEDPSKRTAALETALDCCLPGTDMHARIQARLKKTTPRPNAPAIIFETGENPLSEMSERILQAQRLAALGKRGDALLELQQVAREDPYNEQVWLVLSETHTDPSEKIQALERVLEINPTSEHAQQRKVRLDELQQNPLLRGSHLEARGNVQEALQVYTYIIAHSHLPAERLEAQHRMDDIRLRQEVESFHKVNPTLNLARLTMGPVALFVVMVFMQSGLNPLHTPLLAMAGFLSVLVGSLLVSAVEMVPAHPYWIKLFGLPGTGDEPEMRRGLRLLGIALLLAPFTIFMIEAGHRLGVLRASMLGF